MESSVAGTKWGRKNCFRGLEYFRCRNVARLEEVRGGGTPPKDWFSTGGVLDEPAKTSMKLPVAVSRWAHRVAAAKHLTTMVPEGSRV